MSNPQYPGGWTPQPPPPGYPPPPGSGAPTGSTPAWQPVPGAPQTPQPGPPPYQQPQHSGQPYHGQPYPGPVAQHPYPGQPVQGDQSHAGQGYSVQIQAAQSAQVHPAGQPSPHSFSPQPQPGQPPYRSQPHGIPSQPGQPQFAPPPLPPRNPPLPPRPLTAVSSTKSSFSRMLGAGVAGVQSKLQGYIAKAQTTLPSSAYPGYPAYNPSGGYGALGLSGPGVGTPNVQVTQSTGYPTSPPVHSPQPLALHQPAYSPQPTVHSSGNPQPPVSPGYLPVSSLLSYPIPVPSHPAVPGPGAPAPAPTSLYSPPEPAQGAHPPTSYPTQVSQPLGLAQPNVQPGHPSDQFPSNPAAQSPDSHPPFAPVHHQGPSHLQSSGPQSPSTASQAEAAYMPGSLSPAAHSGFNSPASQSMPNQIGAHASPYPPPAPSPGYSFPPTGPPVAQQPYSPSPGPHLGPSQSAVQHPASPSQQPHGASTPVQLYGSSVPGPNELTQSPRPDIDSSEYQIPGAALQNAVESDQGISSLPQPTAQSPPVSHHDPPAELSSQAPVSTATYPVQSDFTGTDASRPRPQETHTDVIPPQPPQSVSEHPVPAYQASTQGNIRRKPTAQSPAQNQAADNNPITHAAVETNDEQPGATWAGPVPMEYYPPVTTYGLRGDSSAGQPLVGQQGGTVSAPEPARARDRLIDRESGRDSESHPAHLVQPTQQYEEHEPQHPQQHLVEGVAQTSPRATQPEAPLRPQGFQNYQEPQGLQQGVSTGQPLQQPGWPQSSSQPQHSQYAQQPTQYGSPHSPQAPPQEQPYAPPIPAKVESYEARTYSPPASAPFPPGQGLPVFTYATSTPQSPPAQPVPPPQPQPDSISPISTLTSQIESLILTNRSHGPVRSNPDHYFEFPMLTPTAPESSRLCFRNRRVPFARTWYTHPSSPTFYICAWCFDHYISTSRFASSFTKSHRTIEGTCNFHPHRITRVLWPSVLETNDLSPLVEYMQHRAKIPPCLGMTPYTPSPSKPGVKWYIPPPPDSGGIDDFGACQACYEDYLCATPFAGRFTHDPSKTGEGWICDLAIPYTLRALLRRSPTNDWASFVSAVHHRMAKGLCTAQPTTTGTKLWYTVPGAAVHLDICEACYADSFAETPYADVVTMSVDRAGDGWTSIKCDMAGYGPLLDLVFALDAQHAHPDAFRQPLLAIAAAPRCHRADPIIDGLFYNFAPAPVDEFGVCEACYAGVITPLGMAYTLAPSPERVQGRFWCAFNPRMLQLRRFVDALNAEIDSPRSNAGVFEAAARKWMSIMPCPKRDTVPGGQGHEWWGWPDCPVCHECYEDVVRGTALEGEMAFRGVKFENPSPCALYSPAQRQRYLAACESPGNPEEFLAFCRERTKVYNDTVPLLTSLRQQAQADMDAAMLEQVIGHGLRMSDKITFGEPSSQYRSSATGNLYNSYGGVQAERHQAESDRLFRRARDGERRARMLELEARWAQYE